MGLLGCGYCPFCFPSRVRLPDPGVHFDSFVGTSLDHCTINCPAHGKRRCKAVRVVQLPNDAPKEVAVDEHSNVPSTMRQKLASIVAIVAGIRSRCLQACPAKTNSNPTGSPNARSNQNLRLSIARENTFHRRSRFQPEHNSASTAFLCRRHPSRWPFQSATAPTRPTKQANRRLTVRRFRLRPHSAFAVTTLTRSSSQR